MSFVLVIGDTHIPDRAERVDSRIIDLIERGRPWDVVLFTGDLTGLEILDWVEKLGKTVLCVKGNMDDAPLPKTSKVVVSSYTIGLHHGDGVHPRGDVYGLSRIACSLKVDVLVSGHTHTPFIKVSPDKAVLLLNPGSLTGVWGGGGGLLKPSFMLLNISDNIEVELYILEGGNLVSSKVKAVRKGNTWII